MGKNTKVAIVDSGVDPSHEKVKPVESGVQIRTAVDGRIVVDADCSDCAGHGIACAGIICRKAPQALIYSVRIFDQSLSTTGETLLVALEWSIEQEMDVVNLSLGTTDSDFATSLRAACQRAMSAGVVLMAAEQNEGKESYPVTFPEVIGVTCGRVAGRYGYFYRPGVAVECVAQGDAQRLSWLGRSEILSAGTSFPPPISLVSSP